MPTSTVNLRVTARVVGFFISLVMRFTVNLIANLGAGPAADFQHDPPAIPSTLIVGATSLLLSATSSPAIWATALFTASPIAVCWKSLEPKSSPPCHPLHRAVLGEPPVPVSRYVPGDLGHNLVDHAATMSSAARIGSAVRRGTVNIAAGI